MKIEIDKIHDRYTFSVKKNDGKLLYASSKQFFLIPSISSSYQYAWEAYREAKKIPMYHIMSLDKKASEEFVAPVNVDISAESMLEEHYSTILKGIDDKARSVEGDEEKEAVYTEVKMITSELLTIKNNLDNDNDDDNDKNEQIDDMIGYLRKIANKYFSDLLEKDKEEKEGEEEFQPDTEEDVDSIGDIDSMEDIDGVQPGDGSLGGPVPLYTPQGSPFAMASKKVFANIDFEQDILEDYAERVCKVIQHFHPDAIYDINTEHKEIQILENKKPILILKTGEHMMLTNIVPNGSLYSIYPYHKSIFYQKYWKPIVEKIGHIVIDNSILLVAGKTILPDLPNDTKSFTINGWNIDKNKEENIDVSFKGNKRNSIWLFELTESKKITTANIDKNVSKYIEKDYSNALVKCINPKLESLYSRTGVVAQVLPGTNYVEVDVDWGRGLGVQRMAEQDIEIVISE